LYHRWKHFLVGYRTFLSSLRSFPQKRGNTFEDTMQSILSVPEQMEIDQYNKRKQSNNTTIFHCNTSVEQIATPTPLLLIDSGSSWGLVSSPPEINPLRRRNGEMWEPASFIFVLWLHKSMDKRHWMKRKIRHNAGDTRNQKAEEGAFSNYRVSRIWYQRPDVPETFFSAGQAEVINACFSDRYRAKRELLFRCHKESRNNSVPADSPAELSARIRDYKDPASRSQTVSTTGNSAENRRPCKQSREEEQLVYDTLERNGWTEKIISRRIRDLESLFR